MNRMTLVQTCLAALAALVPLSATGCGLDWTLPQAHFDGADENGYVAYWEKIGDIGLSNGFVIPVNIGFSSRRETSSPALGKGWIVPLLESHVEPVDENTARVIMPDGWTFFFLRNGNTQTWRGNSGWLGESDGSVFTLSAPCGWKLRFDNGRIQEIDGSKIPALTYLYDAAVGTQVVADGRVILQLDRDPASGVASDLVIDGQKVDITLAKRPRIERMFEQSIIGGFDPSLAALAWPDGRKQQFSFDTDLSLVPTLAISGPGPAQRTITWDAVTRQIKTDGPWTYTLQPVKDHVRLSRTSVRGELESYEADEAAGITDEKDAGQDETITYRFASGPLVGHVRKIEQVGLKGARTELYSASYFPSGALMREIFYPDKIKMYSEDDRLLKETNGGRVDYEQDLDDQGRVVHVIDTADDLEVKMAYDAAGNQTDVVIQNGKLLYTEVVDHNNKLISLEEDK